MSEEAKRHPGVQETCAVLSSLPPAPARTLWHLLSCPWCLERMLNLALEEEEAGDLAGGGAGAGAPAPEALHQGLDRQELERDDRFARDGERAPALFEELMATPAAAWRSLVESDSRFGSPALAERLLEEAQGVGGTPAAEEEHACLALAVLERVLAGRFGTGRIERLRASGWSLVGRAAAGRRPGSRGGAARRLRGG